MTRRQRRLLLLLSVLISGFGARAQDSKVATGTEIMIVAHPLAAKAGLSIYMQGGNVVDVAVATAYALGVVEPHGSGVGGEGMMLIHLVRTNTWTVIDFKAIAPKKATYETLDYGNISSWSKTVRGASVPGVVAGLELAREQYGRLDRTSVLQPAVDLALKGFDVDSTLSARLKGGQSTLTKDPYAARIYYPTHAVPEPGTILTNPDYGVTLKEIQADGPDAFYRGTIARLIARDAERSGGFITMEDLAAYRAVEREPLRGNYQGMEIVTTPPPGGGMHLIEALNMLKYFNLPQHRIADNAHLHLLAETFKLVFKDERTHNADPAFVPVPHDVVTSQAFAFSRMQAINLEEARHPIKVDAGRIPDKNTTHLSVMDAEGNAVALTITLSSMFGTAHTVEGAGFLLNNEMQNYDPDPSAANALRPHARVVTSLVPTMLVREGRPAYVLGLPGGDAIISTMTQVVVNLLDFGMDLPAAVASPRIFSIFNQRALEIERPVPEETLALLRSRGHDLDLWDQNAYFGVVQAVERDKKTGMLLGVSDGRRSGAAIGK
jgi:gamma-glutamyltranspeptidase/glutathione hydrolase